MKKNRIKVCFVAASDITIKFLLISQIKLMQEQGYEMFSICSPGKWVPDIGREGIKVKTIKIKRKISPFYDFITLAKIWLYLKKEKFDIVNSFTPKPGLLSSIVARAAGVPIVVYSNIGFYFQSDWPWLKKKFFALMDKITAKLCDVVFFVAKPDMQRAVKEKICPPQKVRYLGGWVDIKRFNPLRFDKNFIQRKKEQLGIAPNKKVIGIIARLVKDKGYVELFEAFAQIIKKFPDTLLLIVGQLENEKSDRIDERIFKNYKIEKNILFLGERTDVDELYSLMDVFTLPSWREGIAISVLEALAMERPVVATNVGGIPDSVENGKTGILIPPKNSAELERAIIYLLENPDKAKKMGKSGREKIQRDFDEKLVFERIDKEYKGLIEKKLKS